MKSSWSLVFLPAFALAGTFHGTVLDLNGIPVEGAVVTTGAETVITAADGNWSAARSTGVRQRISRPQVVTSHLSVSHGRLGISWNGFATNGRRDLSMPQPRTDFAARQLESTPVDTLRVFWKDKRLVQLPITSTDSSDITIKIDTAWQDDFGIPWNPRVEYGSLFDERDGQVYRTVKIGSQVWMAENLAYVIDQSTDHTFLDSDAEQMGGFFSWADVMNFKDSCLYKKCSSQINTPHQGACPENWHLPTTDDWWAMSDEIESVHQEIDPITVRLDIGSYLKSNSGWDANCYYGSDLYFSTHESLPQSGPNGIDEFGFRFTPGALWTATDWDNDSSAASEWFYCNATFRSEPGQPKTHLLPARCLQN